MKTFLLYVTFVMRILHYRGGEIQDAYYAVHTFWAKVLITPLSGCYDNTWKRFSYLFILDQDFPFICDICDENLTQ